MISLVFLLCFAPSQCMSVAYEPVFQNEEDCNIVAQNLIYTNRQEIKKGTMPPHTAEYLCYFWGEKT